jgi:NAD(P)-dependent dehydrogenase (short-subunit alcohol dehydrogenase family)
MDLNLKGRTAFVTGASRGIGRSIAIALAAEGVNIRIYSVRLLRSTLETLLRLNLPSTVQSRRWAALISL